MKKIIKVLSLLMVSSLLAGCKNNGKGGSSEQPVNPDNPSQPEIVLPNNLEDAGIIEFQNMKPITPKMMEKLSESSSENLEQFKSISEFNIIGGEVENYLNEPSQPFERYVNNINVKIFTEDYAEMSGEYYINYGDKYQQLDGDGMKMEDISATGVRQDNIFYLNMNMSADPFGVGEIKDYDWQAIPFPSAEIPTQSLIFNLVSDAFRFYGSPIGYVEVGDKIYLNSYTTDYDSYTYNSIHYYEIEYRQTIIVLDKQYNLLSIYEAYEEWYDHDLFSGEYKLNLAEKYFTLLEIKRSNLPACDASKRSAFIESIPYYYVSRNPDNDYMVKLSYQVASNVVLDEDGKLTGDPGFGSVSTTSQTIFVDKNTVGVCCSPYASGTYMALSIVRVDATYLSLKGPTAGTYNYSSFNLTEDPALMSAIAEFTGGSVLKYNDHDYLIIPVENWKGITITLSAINPVDPAIGVAAYPEYYLY